MTEVPTAICTVHGYELFADGPKPFVMRKWTTYAVDSQGERVPVRNKMRLELTPEHFTGGTQAKEVYDTLVMAWQEWREWQQANGKE